VPVIEYERMKDEIVTLKREVMKANYEKDKILAMKISEMGMEVNKELLSSELEEPEKETAENPEETIQDEIVATVDADMNDEEVVETVEVGEPRFPRLSSDSLYGEELFLISQASSGSYGTYNTTLNDIIDYSINDLSNSIEK
jgi:hypothetical protein